MGPPPGDCCGGVGAHDGSYLGPEHSGVSLALDPANPLPFGTPGALLEPRAFLSDLAFNAQTRHEYKGLVGEASSWTAYLGQAWSALGRGMDEGDDDAWSI